MFGPGYTISNQLAGTPQALTTTAKTLVRARMAATLMKRIALWEMDFSALGINTTTDCQNSYSGAFCDATGAGTGTAITPLGTQSNGGTVLDTAASTLCLANYTAEPTTVAQTGTFFGRSPNQRGTAFWQASPGGELFFPATASTGPVFQALSTANTGTAWASVRFSEI